MNTDNSVRPFELRAAEDVAKFFALTAPTLFTDFTQFLRARGEERKVSHPNAAAGSRVGSTHTRWVADLEKSFQDVKSSLPLTPTVQTKPEEVDPLEARFFPATVKTAPSTPAVASVEVLSSKELAEIERDEAVRKEAREKRKAFCIKVSDEACERLDTFNTNMSMTDLARPPEIVEFDGEKSLFVYSYTLVRYGKEIRHDYRYNNVSATTKHPEILIMPDETKLFRSITEGESTFYVKVFPYKEDGYLRGYFNEKGKGKDEEDIERYYQVTQGTVKPISKLEYQKLENRGG